YRNAGSMPDRYEFSVGFKLPVYFRRKQRAAVAEQQLNLDRATHDLDAAGRTVQLQLTDAYLMAQTSRRLMRMYADTVIPQAKLTLESSLTAYQTGSVDFLNVLSNFMTAVEYEDNYQQEALGYQLALVQLEEITGSPITGLQEGS
ncbi:MAG: TolC family protein, partial [Bryobacteraceae bacterium]